jgi:aminoglycoside phosphotransferase family enzyme
MKSKAHRLCQIHGDFHPFNILFTDKTDFILLDRSRGEYGEAADDVSALAINYIFWSLIKYDCFKTEFKELFDLFFKTYLENTKDEEILEIIQPFFTFRAIVIANPIFYPDSWFKEQGFKGDPKKIRRTLFNFAHKVLKEKKFKINKINKYLECRSQYG